MLLDERSLPFKIIGVYHLRRKYCSKSTEKRNFHVLSYRLSGEADFTRGEQKLHVTHGDLLHISANTEYYQYSMGEELIAVHLEIPNADSSDLEILSGGNTGLCDELFRRLYDEWTNGKPGHIFASHATLYEILATASRQAAYRQAHPGIQSNVHRMIQYMDKHFTDANLSVADMAEKAGISEFYFRKLFRNEIGESPARYIMDKRIRYAQELLTSGYFTVSEVAEEAGFTDAKYFSTVFRKETGDTPTHYRNVMRAQKDTSNSEDEAEDG